MTADSFPPQARTCIGGDWAALVLRRHHEAGDACDVESADTPDGSYGACDVAVSGSHVYIAEGDSGLLVVLPAHVRTQASSS